VGRGAFVVALLLAGCAARHPAAPVEHLPEPLAIYGRLPTIEDVAISPDGTRLAYVQTTDDNQRIVGIVSLADHSVVASVRAGDAKLRAIEWVDDQRLLLTTSVTAVPLGLIGARSELGMLQVYDVSEHRSRPLLGREDRTLNTAFGRPMIRQTDGRSLLYVGGSYLKADRTLPGLFSVDAASGDEELVLRGKPDAREWLVDDRGEVVVEQTYDNDDRRSVFSIRREDALREVATADDPFDNAGIVGFGPGADSLVVEVPEANDSIWKPLSLKDGTLGSAMQKGIDRPLLDRCSDRVIGWAREDDEPRYGFVDPALQARWDQVVRSFKDERVRLVSASDDWSKLVVLVEGERDGYAYEVADTTTHGVERVGAVYEGLPQVFDVMRVTYPAADGLEITAYLTLPATRPVKNLPLVVLPHGGPAARDVLQFDWWAQALAASGYAVLQPNYRGSTESVQLFTAGFGEFGRKMQTDLSDGVRFLARKGVVDPARVCIVGASYGGYAALAGVTLDPGVYRCAISVAGPSDLPRYRGRTHGRSGHGDSPTQRYWDRYWGATSPDDPILATISPSRHAANVTVPVLLIHGRDDTVVPYEQSEIMADAMEDAGKPVELVTLNGEDHWLSRGATRLQMLEYVIGFLRVHNPPG
jgi:dipeptidyl aminopeptidase/acylaminoacyl peptidase